MRGHGIAVFVRGTGNNVTGKGTLEEGPERASSLAICWLRILLVTQGLGFDPGQRSKIPHVLEQLSLCTAMKGPT